MSTKLIYFQIDTETFAPGERYLKFHVCHGCPECWELVPDRDNPGQDKLIINKPHVLSILDVTQKVTELKNLAEKDTALTDFAPTVY